MRIEPIEVEEAGGMEGPGVDLTGSAGNTAAVRSILEARAERFSAAAATWPGPSGSPP
mgnify:CR=1 FL=1